jgi:MFS family permease
MRAPGRTLGGNYWRLWTASGLSNLADGIATVAYPWLASAVTRQPVHIALVGVATRLPWLVFTLPAGVITDRVDRRRLVLAMDGLRTAVTVGVALVVLWYQDRLASPAAIAAGTATPPPGSGLLLMVVYLSALAFGVAEVLRDNAAQTLMPSIVVKDRLERANGLLGGVEMVMNSFVGPPLGGVLLAVAFSLPFFVNAGTFAVALAMVALLAGSYRPVPAAGHQRSFGRELKEGFGWLWKHRLLRALAILLGLINGAWAAAMATVVLFSQEVLGLDAAGYGLLLSAAAAGGVLGSLLADRVARRTGSGPALAATFLTGGLGAIGIGLTHSAPLVWAMLAVTTFTGAIWNVITVSLRQTIIPDALLGRVNSVYRFFGWGMIPVGLFLGGLLVAGLEAPVGRDWALRAPFLASGLIQLALLFYVVRHLTTSRLEAAKAVARSPGTGEEAP